MEAREAEDAVDGEAEAATEAVDSRESRGKSNRSAFVMNNRHFPQHSYQPVHFCMHCKGRDRTGKSIWRYGGCNAFFLIEIKYHDMKACNASVFLSEKCKYSTNRVANSVCRCWIDDFYDMDIMSMYGDVVKLAISTFSCCLITEDIEID